MGDEFLRKRGKRFKHLSSEAYDQELATSNLFSDRQHVFSESYPCIAEIGIAAVAVGQEVTIYDVGGDDLLVRRQSQNLGIIHGPDAYNLREAMRHDPTCRRMVTALIERQSVVSNRIYIRISETNKACTNSDGSYL
jgi:hypothetical protein